MLNMRRDKLFVALILILLVAIMPFSLAFSDVSVGGGVELPEKEEDPNPIPITSGKYYITGDHRAQLKMAAEVGAARGFRTAQRIPRSTGSHLAGVITGELSAEFRHVAGLAEHPIVRQESERRVRETAKQLGVTLNDYQVKAFVEQGHDSIEPTVVNQVGAFVNGLANTGLVAAGLAAPWAAPAKASVAPTLVQRVGSYVFVQQADLTTGALHVGDEVIQGDYIGAVQAGALATGGLILEAGTGKAGQFVKKLAGTGAKLARKELVKEATVLSKVLPEIANLGVRMAPKVLPKATALTFGITAGTALAEELPTLYDDMIFKHGGTFSEAQITEVTKLQEVPPTDSWVEIPSGNEGWIYSKVARRVGEDVKYVLFAKEQSTGEIRVLERNLQWSKVGAYEGMQFGTTQDLFDQASTTEFAVIDAGQSFWQYKKHVSSPGDEVLYSRGPNGELMIYDDDEKTWVIPDLEKQEQFLIEERRQYAEKQRVLAEETEALESELPPLEIDYDSPKAPLADEKVSLTTEEAGTLDDSTYYYDLEGEPSLEFDPFADQEADDGLTYSSSDVFDKLGIVPMEVPEVSGEIASLASKYLSEEDVVRRTELRDNRLRMQEYLDAPLDGKSGEFEWRYDEVKKKFYGEITLTHLNDEGNLEARLLTFSNPGSFVQILQEFKGAEHVWGEEVWKTTEQIDLVLWRDGWKKKETADLGKPKPICK